MQGKKVTKKMTFFPTPWQLCENLDEDRNLEIVCSLEHSHLICTRRPIYQATDTFLRSAFTSYKPDLKISLSSYISMLDLQIKILQSLLLVIFFPDITHI